MTVKCNDIKFFSRADAWRAACATKTVLHTQSLRYSATKVKFNYSVSLIINLINELYDGQLAAPFSAIDFKIGLSVIH